jgi:hypothetical protein
VASNGAGYMAVVVLAAGLLTIADSVKHDQSPANKGVTRSDAAVNAPGGRATPTVVNTRSTNSRITLRPAPVTLDTPGFVSWALLDRRTNAITGSPNISETNDTASMIKAWLAADYLRRASAAGESPSQQRLNELSIMIRDSDNAAAQDIYLRNGQDDSIERLFGMCGLTDSSAYRGWWSKTKVSARDTARMGACIADGRAAGQAWTPWLLDEMRQVRGEGDFGARTAMPPEAAAHVAIKNGWLVRSEDGLWHVSCLAIGDDWVLGVLTRYPGRLGLEHGAGLCRSVGQQLMTS